MAKSLHSNIWQKCWLLRLLVVFIMVLVTQFKSFGFGDTLRFGIISDIQYCDCDPAGSRIYRGAPEKLRQAIDTLNITDIDFLLNLGDLIDRSMESFDTILPILYSGSFDVYNLLGNHEYSGLSQSQKDSLYIKLNMPSEYYSFKRGGWRFVMLNTNDVSTYAHEPSSAEYLFADSMLQASLDSGATSAYLWNGGVGEQQFEWLDSLLRVADSLGEFVIVSAHSIVFPNSLNAMQFKDNAADILEKHNSVKLFVAGHYHDGGYALNNTLHYWTIKALLDYADSTSYALVDASESQIKINGFGREPDRTLHFNSYYNLDVDNGLGGGRILQGDTVLLRANASNPSTVFSYWSGDIAFLESVFNPVVKLKMPAFDVSLKANFDVATSFASGDPFAFLKFYSLNSMSGIAVEHNTNIRSISVLTLTGRIIFQDTPNKKKTEINTNNWSRGIYFIRLVDDYGFHTTKKIILGVE